MNISEVIDNLQYVKDCLSDERGSDFSGVEALTIAIEIIKMEPVKAEMYFKRQEIEKMIRLNTALTALKEYTEEKECMNCKYYGRFSLVCARCDDDCSLYEPQKGEEL